MYSSLHYKPCSPQFWCSTTSPGQIVGVNPAFFASLGKVAPLLPPFGTSFLFLKTSSLFRKNQLFYPKSTAGAAEQYLNAVAQVACVASQLEAVSQRRTCAAGCLPGHIHWVNSSLRVSKPDVDKRSCCLCFCASLVTQSPSTPHVQTHVKRLLRVDDAPKNASH